MENASKALIIAGAILLSILIIGIGVYVFQSASGVVKRANMNQQEILQYNEPFTTYGGVSVSGTQAMALCESVRTHNLSNKTDLTRQIEVKYDTEYAGSSESASAEDKDFTTTATTVKNQLRSGYTYKITFAYDSTTGFVTKIGIKKN